MRVDLVILTEGVGRHPRPRRVLTPALDQRELGGRRAGGQLPKKQSGQTTASSNPV